MSASFSKSGKYYILHCQGPGIPSYTLKCVDDDRRKSYVMFIGILKNKNFVIWLDILKEYDAMLR